MPENVTTPRYPDTIGMCGVDCALASCYRDGRCHGCRSENTHQKRTSKWKCRVRSCVIEKGLAHCGECGEFSCVVRKHLDTTYRKSYHIDLQENCRELARVGPVLWEQQSRERYTCPDCGALIDPYHRACYRCGKKWSPP